jgi:mRNA interferase MazF
MVKMERGEVWWAKLGQPVGTRPVLLLSRDSAYEIRNAITVATITRRIRGIKVEVSLGRNEGMNTDCVVNLDDIITIRKLLLESKITTLSSVKMCEVDIAIIYALDIKTERTTE